MRSHPRWTTTGAANGGTVVARVHADGLRLEVVDQTGGSGVLRIESTGGNPHAAGDLGLEGDGVGGTIVGRPSAGGTRFGADLQSERRNGLPPGVEMRVRDGAFESTVFTIGPDIESFGQLIADLNRQAVQDDRTFRFELNDAANGIRIVADNSFELNVVGDLAESLGLLGSGHRCGRGFESAASLHRREPSAVHPQRGPGGRHRIVLDP